MSETEVKQEVEKVAVAEELDTKGDPSAPAKSGLKSEPTHLKNDAEDLGAPVVKPTDSNPDATKKVSKVSDQVNKDANDASLPKDNKPAGMKEEETEIEGEEEIAEDKVEASEMDIDLSDDVKALVSTDADLSEEFKDKAETMKEAMVEKVDSYLNYVVEEWMKENELAVERGIRTEIAEDFITGLKTLFKEHYIDVPEEKYNVLDDLTAQKEDLEAKLNEQIEKNVELTKKVSESDKASVLADVTADLAETEKEKFAAMAENIEYDSADKFKEKLETVKESYFPKTKLETADDSVDSVAANEPTVEVSSDAMAAYTAAISKNVKSVKI
mgnify:CR=1 FL=1